MHPFEHSCLSLRFFLLTRNNSNPRIEGKVFGSWPFTQQSISHRCRSWENWVWDDLSSHFDKASLFCLAGCGSSECDDGSVECVCRPRFHSQRDEFTRISFAKKLFSLIERNVALCLQLSGSDPNKCSLIYQSLCDSWVLLWWKWNDPRLPLKCRVWGKRIAEGQGRRRALSGSNSCFCVRRRIIIQCCLSCHPSCRPRIVLSFGVKWWTSNNYFRPIQCRSISCPTWPPHKANGRWNILIHQEPIIIHYCCLCDCASFQVIYFVAREQM